MTMFNSFYGGLADSPWRGISGSFAAGIGIDIHSTPGQITVNQALAKESAATVTALCKNVLVASDGNSYWFSSTDGKIWKRTAAAVWSLVHTNTKSSCLGAREYNGYIYYVGAGFVGRQTVALAASEASWSSQADAWQTLSNIDTVFAPMEEVNGKLFIGNGKYLASWDGSTYIDNDLDLTAPFRISALTPSGIDILIGTYVGTGTTNLIKVNYCKVFRWDTVSDSYNDSDVVYEVGINAFIPKDNQILIQAGIAGNIYYYDGTQLIPYKRIVGTYSPVKYGLVYPSAVGYFKGLSLFGFSNSPDTANSTGNPAPCGVYSLGRHNKNYPEVLNLEFPVSVNTTLVGQEIGCIAVIGNDLLVSWKSSSSYGIDKLSTSAKYSAAYLETLVLADDNSNKKIANFKAGYISMPASCSITFSHKINYASSYTTITNSEVETTKKEVRARQNLIDCHSLQTKVAFTVNANDAPILDYLNIDIK